MEASMTMHMKAPRMIEALSAFEVQQTASGPVTVVTTKVLFPGTPEKFALEIAAGCTASDEQAAFEIMSPTCKRGLQLVKV
jgi:hypothetical protein